MVEGIAAARPTLPTTSRPALGGARRHARVRAVRHARMGTVAGERALPRRLLADRGQARTPRRSRGRRGDPERRRRRARTTTSCPTSRTASSSTRSRTRGSPSNYGVDGTEHPDPGAVQWLAVNTLLLDLPSRTLLDSLVEQRPVRRRLVRPRRDGRPPREAARAEHPIDARFTSNCQVGLLDPASQCGERRWAMIVGRRTQRRALRGVLAVALPAIWLVCVAAAPVRPRRRRSTSRSTARRQRGPRVAARRRSRP